MGIAFADGSFGVGERRELLPHFIKSGNKGGE